MDAVKYEALKRKVFTEKSFDAIWDYFMDHFGENAEFVKLGRPIPEFTPVMVEVLKQVVAMLLGRPPAIILHEWRLVEIPEFRFTHGAGLVNGMMGSLFHFDAEDVGMFGLCLPTGETKMARFSTKAGPGPKREPSVN